MAAADLILVNARVHTMDPARPHAGAVAVRRGRILAVGSDDEVRTLAGASTAVVDAQGGLAIPAFHDAHLHLLSYARAQSRLDCRGVRSMADLRRALAVFARERPDQLWVRGVGYDEAALAERRHPDRHDLDAAIPDRPVRLQHRTLHADVLNTCGLRRAGLFELHAPEIEREPAHGEPTGRLFHAGELLRGRVDHATAEELAADVRAASQRLLAWGITTVQDASVTNGPEELELLRRLSVGGDLPLRVVVMRGARHWREMRELALAPTPALPRRGRERALAPPDPMVRVGPIKFMLDERTSDPEELRRGVAAASAAEEPVAIHAVSDAEVAMALGAVRSAPRRLRHARIEHGAVLPDAFLAELRALRIIVVGQPALIYERGDAYRADYPPAQHGWLHRAGSLLRNDIPYAVGSDAPVASPCPYLALHALLHRRTSSGRVLGAAEAVAPGAALAALTRGPALAAAVGHELGQLRPGSLADIAVLDPDLSAPAAGSLDRTTRLTMAAGRILWSAPGS